MTRYTVTWVKSAEDDLARIWMASSQQQAVADAADAIDARLAEDPDCQGSEVAEGLRRLRVMPLEVLYSVLDQDRVVEVANVRLVQPVTPNPQSNGQAKPPSP